MLEIYRDFELITMEPIFTDFFWRRRFSRPGEFQLTTAFSREAWEYFKPYDPRRPNEPGHVIYKRDVDEAAFIESRNVVDTIDNETMLIVRGRFLPSVLDRRQLTLAGNFTLQSLLSNIINNNFLAGAGSFRSMAGHMRLLPFTIPLVNVSVEYQRRNVYEAVTALLEESRIGLRANYNFATRTIDISFYEPVKTDVTFSKQFANIIEQDYRDDIEMYKNVVYVEDRLIHNDSTHRGFNRREIAVSAPRQGESTTLTQTALDALNENRAIRTISSVVNPYNNQFEYLKDWTIGSEVLSESRQLGFSEREVITEITEFYDASGMNLEVITGDYIERGNRRVRYHR